MKINKNFWLMLLMAGWAMMSSTAAQASVRDTIDINWGWQFHRGDIKGISLPSGNIQNTHILDEAMQGCEVVNLLMTSNSISPGWHRGQTNVLTARMLPIM